MGSTASHILELDGSVSIWGKVLFDQGIPLRGDAYGVVKGGGETQLSSQISQINPGDRASHPMSNVFVDFFFPCILPRLKG